MCSPALYNLKRRTAKINKTSFPKGEGTMQQTIVDIPDAIMNLDLSLVTEKVRKDQEWDYQRAEQAENDYRLFFATAIEGLAGGFGHVHGASRGGPSPPGRSSPRDRNLSSSSDCKITT
jgi:hypothetical protein